MSFAKSPKLLGTFSTVAIALFLFASSTIESQAQQNDADWFGTGGNYPYNWNYNSQTDVNSSNVQRLQVSWVIPNAKAPMAYQGADSIVFTPIIVNGIVYTVTNFHLAIALDARNGKIIWQRQLPLLNFKGLDPLWDRSDPLNNITGHYHSIWYTESVRGTPLVWIAANNNSIFAYNALTGDLNLKLDTFSSLEKVPGHYGFYGTQSRSLAIDEKRGILVAGSGVSEGSQAGRGFFVGFDITTTPPRELWRTFMIPPQDGSDPEWSLKSVQNMSHAYIFNGREAVDLKKLSNTQLRDLLVGDWGDFGFNGTHSYAGAGTGWGGSWSLDPQTGIAYVGTGQPSADWNATTRPGANLWSSSMLALDVTTGKFIWGFQTTTHDLWDWDCSWSVMLGNATISGQTHKVVYKGCKNGYFYALDAATGGMLWYFDPPNIRRTQYSELNDPLNKGDLTKGWLNYPSTDAVVQNPCGAGGIESNPALDPTTNTVILGAHNCPSLGKVVPIKGPGVIYGISGRQSVAGPPLAKNTTIWALDANTGIPKWSYFIPDVGFRGGLSVSGGVVYVPAPDGYIYLIDVNNGQLIGQKYIGAALITQPAVARDANGDFRLVMPASGPAGNFVFGCGITTPGFIFALELGPEAIEVKTVTLSQTTTQTLPGTTQTQTVQGPSTGVAPELLYGVTAIAVIFIIVSGVLALRRRRAT